MRVTDNNGDAIVGANFTSSSFPTEMEIGTSEDNGYFAIVDWFVAGDFFSVDVVPGAPFDPIIGQNVTVGSVSPDVHTFQTEVLSS